MLVMLVVIVLGNLFMMFGDCRVSCVLLYVVVCLFCYWCGYLVGMGFWGGLLGEIVGFVVFGGLLYGLFVIYYLLYLLDVLYFVISVLVVYVLLFGLFDFSRMCFVMLCRMLIFLCLRFVCVNSCCSCGISFFGLCGLRKLSVISVCLRCMYICLILLFCVSVLVLVGGCVDGLFVCLRNVMCNLYVSICMVCVRFSEL